MFPALPRTTESPPTLSAPRSTPTPRPPASLARLARREFLGHCGVGVGAAALGALLARETAAARPPAAPNFAPRAKAVIFLFMAGGPSQLELFEDKPKLRELDGQPPPESFVAGRRFAFLTGKEKLLGPKQKFARHGQCGAVVSDLLPHHARVVDELCFLKGVATDVFNHGPAKLFMQTGFAQPGRPALGSWALYGLGSAADNLPGFVVLQSGPRGPRAGSALWSSGFLPTSLQGAPFRGQGDPILNLRNPRGFDRAAQADFTEAVKDLNRLRFDAVGDAEIETRVASYEMAFRMQMSAPELMDLAAEPASVLALYGAKPGAASFANNALLARRLVERGARFVQLYHTSWDQHGGGESLEQELPLRCREVDQASAALVLDLKQRGMLDDTLVIWGGEFGRTPMGETRKPTGRDHHVDAFTMWLAGGGVKAGFTHGQTDDLGFGVVEGRVHVHDLHATILRLLGLDHTRLTFHHQGLDFRLTGVEPSRVVDEILA